MAGNGTYVLVPRAKPRVPGADDQPGPGGDIQLAADITDMITGGFRRDGQTLRNGLIRQALGNHVQYRAFTPGQAFEFGRQLRQIASLTGEEAAKLRYENGPAPVIRLQYVTSAFQRKKVGTGNLGGEFATHLERNHDAAPTRP